jgi:hypothetical protein
MSDLPTIASMGEGWFDQVLNRAPPGLRQAIADFAKDVASLPGVETGPAKAGGRGDITGIRWDYERSPLANLFPGAKPAPKVQVFTTEAEVLAGLYGAHVTSRGERRTPMVHVEIRERSHLDDALKILRTALGS